MLLPFLPRSSQVAVPSGKYQHPWPTASKSSDPITNLAPAPEYNKAQAQSATVEIVDSKSPLVLPHPRCQ